ncbi:ATP-binding protein [Leptolyngbyaceae cyanobacterium UHCC 1019]
MKDSYFADPVHLLHQVTCRIHASLDERELHQTIAQELCCALEGDCAELILYDLDTQTVVVAAAFCRIQADQEILKAPVGLTLHLGLELEQQSARNCHNPWIVQDVAVAQISEAERLLLQTAGMHSLLMIPIVHQNRLLGTACVGQTISCRLWTADEMHLAKLVAEQAAIALHHARRYSESQHQAQREQVLNHLAQRIRKSLDLDITINTTLAELLSLIKATLIYFAVPASQSSTLLQVTHHVEINNGLSQHPSCQLKQLGQPNSSRQEAVIAVETEIELRAYGATFGQRVLSQDIVVVANTQSDDIDRQSQATFQQQHVGAWLSVPVWYQERLGYLIALKPEPCNWTKDEQAALEAVANQLAIAISHRQFYAQTQQQAQQAQTQAEQLAQTLKQLYETQSQLIQSEKMSSLGQMVAGIAHEVNNPINFIYGNIPFVTQYTEQLLTLINLYQVHCLDTPNEVAEFAAAVDLPFIQSDLMKILGSMRTGADRVRQIVLTLRNFSRLDEAEKKFVDVHEGLEAALLLLNHRLRPHIQVVRHYGDLPLIDSYPGQLNQVFLNLLSNAIDAVNSVAPFSSTPGQITISTCVVSNPASSNNRVQIRIQDTGSGIPLKYQSKVFDPFFTTKPVGSGTGLGLSISYRIIVHKHQGNLWFETHSSSGTEFIIELPVVRNQ